MSSRTAPDRHLECRLCHQRFDLAPIFTGCPKCGTSGVLEVGYDYDALKKSDVLAQWKHRPPGLWSYHELLPLAEPAQAVTLAEGGTPLIRLEVPGPGRLWLKDETRNPTGAHKDRFHSSSISMARRFGFEKIVASTTGNHGVAAAAYAARGGAECVIFCDPRAPVLLRDLIQFYGGGVAVVTDRHRYVPMMVTEKGWYPSTGLTPNPVGTPYGVEGYKTMAYEIYFQLGERFPDRMVVPVSSGDVFYGPWKGFRELSLLGARGADRLPRMFVAQSAACDPIVAGIKSRAKTVPIHPNPSTIALSIGDETAAPIALTTAYESQGGGVAVPDAEIIAAVRLLAAAGIATEPSGAAGVAAALSLQRSGELGADEDVVCVLTGAAAKWPDTLRLGLAPRELIAEDPAVIAHWIDQIDAEIERGGSL